MKAMTTIKISKELSLNLLIVAKLNGFSKEKFIDMLLHESLKPHLIKIKRQRFQ